MSLNPISFGPFVVDPSQRILFREGEPVALTPKAFDLLVVLAGRAGRVVRKDEFRAAWPDTIVDENNLAFQISTLRKALGERERGERYIVTIPGQGYQLIAPMQTGERSEVVLQESEIVTVTVEETAVSRRVVVLVSVLAIGSMAIGSWFVTRQRHEPVPAAAPRGLRSMAVLPFKPLLAAQRDEALELGMADSLIRRVSGAHHVAVRPLSAVRRYVELEQDPLVAGRELQVDAVLDGTVHHGGGRIRVTARLLRVSDATQMWEGRFDEPVGEIFSVQDSISRRLAAELRLGEVEQRQLLKHSTENVEAYRAYVLGVVHVQRLRREDIEIGISHFQRAAALDPRYAAPHAAIADAYAILPISAERPPHENFARARVEAMKAAELDPELADAYAVLGLISFWSEWDWAAAEAHFRRAIALNPGNVVAHMRYAHLLSNIGRHDEAAVQIREALRLDPLSRNVNAFAGQFLLQAGNLEGAIAQLRHALSIDPDFWIARMNLGKAYEQQRRFDEALRELERANRGAGDNVEARVMMGYVYGLQGNRKGAEDVLAEVMAFAKRRPVAASKIALVHLGLGERDEALRWLRKACGERDLGLTFLRANPRWSQLKSDVRFQEIEQCVGLP